MQPEDAPPPRPRVLPRRGRRGPAGRFRLIIFGVIAAGIFLLMSLRGLAGFYTDFLWFDSLGQGDVFRAVIGAQVVLVLLFMLLFFLILYCRALPEIKLELRALRILRSVLQNRRFRRLKLM